MAEDISAMMDGEVDADHVDAIYRRLRNEQELSTWVCYHVIGDVLRADGVGSRGFADRFARRLAAEQTVLCPPRRRETTPARTAWAIAASAAAVAVVGWVAFEGFEPSAPRLTATATSASARTVPLVPATQVRRGGGLEDYVLVHQEYSPATMFQGVQPYARAVSVDGAAGR